LPAKSAIHTPIQQHLRILPMKLQVLVGWLGTIASLIVISLGAPSHPQESARQEPPSTVEPDVALATGFKLRSQGDHLGALEFFDQALQLAPNSAEGYVAKASLLYQQGRSIEAIILYDNAIRLNPKLVAAHLGKAQALARQGKRPEARALLKSVQQNFSTTGEPERAAMIEHLLPGL
jgi:tetratricopeptide (TPR) repeat protein